MDAASFSYLSDLRDCLTREFLKKTKRWNYSSNSHIKKHVHDVRVGVVLEHGGTQNEFV